MAAINVPEDAKARKQLHDAARRLMFATEGSHELMHRVLFSQIPITVAKVAADIGVFEALSARGYERCTTERLAQMLNVDGVLLLRILRGLAAHGLIGESTDGTFHANEATKLFAMDSVKLGIDHNQMTMGPAHQALPAYLKEQGYRNPIDANYVPLNVGHKTDLPAFEWVQRHPVNLKAMIGTMQAQRVGQVNWFAEPGIFPVQDFTLSQADVEAGRVLMVDIGGGGGQQCIALRTAQPKLGGKVVLQDLPAMITSLDEAQDAKLAKLLIETQAADFTKPQPVVGVKVFYMRNVCHDWPDEKCVLILKNVRKAMAPDSILVIDDIVVREGASSHKQVNYDISMMVALAAMERTETQWRALLDVAGLRLRDVKEYDEGSGDSAIFAVPA